MMCRYRKIKVLLVAVTALAFTACEKGIDNVHYPSAIYFPQSGLNEVSLLLGESTWQLGVYRSGINQDNRTFEVSVVYDPNGGETFINDSTNYDLVVDGQPILFKDLPESMKYKLLPENYYSLPQGRLTINSEQERAFYNIQFTKVDQTFEGSRYILPLKIEDVTPQTTIVPEKSATILHLAGYRNGYEGRYRVLGEVTGPQGFEPLKIDTYYDAKSIGANSVRIPGPVNGMQVKLTVSGNTVEVRPAEGSEHYNIQGVEGKSTWSGEFSEKYQRNKGDFSLEYTYEIEKDVQGDDGSVETETQVYTVKEALNFWL